MKNIAILFFRLIMFLPIVSNAQQTVVVIDSEDKNKTSTMSWDEYLATSSKQVEDEISNQSDINDIDFSLYIKDILVKDIEITGNWYSCDWHDSEGLEIKKENDYKVTFMVYGDLASWKLERTATYSNGVIELNKPVLEYAPLMPYKKFYSVSTPFGDRLVSQQAVKDWVIDEKNKKLDWTFLETYVVLKKGSSKQNVCKIKSFSEE
jgi:hypothetical protein